MTSLFLWRLAFIFERIRGQAKAQTTKPSVPPTNMDASIGNPSMIAFKAPNTIPIHNPIPKGRSISTARTERFRTSSAGALSARDLAIQDKSKSEVNKPQAGGCLKIRVFEHSQFSRRQVGYGIFMSFKQISQFDLQAWSEQVVVCIPFLWVQDKRVGGLETLPSRLLDVILTQFIE